MRGTYGSAPDPECEMIAVGEGREIRAMLYDGDWDGPFRLVDSCWNGEIFSAPRESMAELFDMPGCNRAGVYLLLSGSKVYVGQAVDLGKRLKEHLSGKDWWTRAVLLTSRDNSLDRDDIAYLERVLIDKAMLNVDYESDNIQRGMADTVSYDRRILLDQDLDKALALLEFIGVSEFFSGQEDSLDVTKRLALGKRTKSEAIRFLADRGVLPGGASKRTYATLNDRNGWYWMNPDVSLLSEDWSIILNDTRSRELVVLQIPAGTLSVANGPDGSPEALFARSDKPWQLDLHLKRAGLVDTRSEVDFSQFLTARVSYAE